MPIPTQGMSLNLMSTPSVIGLNSVLSSIAGAAAFTGSNVLSQQFEATPQIVVGTAIIDKPPGDKRWNNVPPLKFFTAATVPGPLPEEVVSLIECEPPISPATETGIPDQQPRSTVSSTSLSQPSFHESGWKVALNLDHQGRTGNDSEGCWRSGETLSGFIQLDPIPGVSQKAISSVIVRVYVQSNTVYTAYRFVQTSETATGLFSKLKTSGAGGITAINEIKGEWHRAYIDGGSGREIWHGGELEEIQREVEGDFPLLGEEQQRIPILPVVRQNEPQSLPFAFTLPTTVRISTSNSLNHRIPGRGELQTYRRTPPPSIPGTQHGEVAVEWIAEVLVRFQDLDEPGEDLAVPSTPINMNDDDSLPNFEMATFDPASRHSEFGFLSSSPNLQVHRVVFPFEPSDHDAQDLYSFWRPTAAGAWSETVARYNGLNLDEIEDDRPVTEGIVPKFGRDPRDEALGGSNMGPKRSMKGKLVDRLGGRDMWMSFEKRMGIKSKLGRLTGWIRVETSVRRPLMLARHSPFLPILLHFSSGREERPKVRTSQSACVIRAAERMSRPSQFHMDEMRREVVDLYDDEIRPTMETITPIDTMENALSRSRTMPLNGLKRRGLMLSLGDANGVDLRIDFDMQSDGTGTNGKALTPGKGMGLSCRMPNVELEYIISVTIHPVGQPSFYALRVPVQIIRGDLDDAPPFPVGDSPFPHANGGSTNSDSHSSAPEPPAHDDVADSGLPSYETL
ncbi:BZ3500_MvSof-1268-A1-R1_Chr2-3g05238 [Microbotryum saponariae]|uniref:BZ3500_MvSof-1268-A1-R1_Chr2-3g05238 protein n=1 Tax=Microbotryum saponariae TaxID=289078 RepID=A0A2X0L3C5_9BASI|nr:BZ3500_MvSof-1268-A1-R1_Chr2-3g05238 [Microbotryum saponariae]SDA01064.1 BZ3501_MvSof-1269-A2-R1_Chr2-2g04911 [Microbotryum saponariae]